MTDEETEQQRQLSIQAATDLLELLLRRGYLHENVVPILGDADRGNPQRDGQSPSYFSTDDSSCEVVMLLKGDKNGNGSCCCTYPALKQALETELSVHGGRASFSEIITVLKLQNEKPLLRIVEQHRDHRRYFQVGNDILSVTYLEDQCQKVFDSLLSTTENGFSLVSDIANQRFHLPMGITLEALEERLPDEVQILHLEAGTAIATRNYLYDLNGKVFEAFQELQEPALVSDICQSHHWDNALVAPWVQSFCQDGKLSGDFHGGGSPDVSAKSILIGAMYTPHAHTQQQRKAVDDLFSTQGYLTATRGVALGLSKSKMGEYVQEQFPSAVIISESLVVKSEVVISPLEAILQEAVSSESFVDLQDHIPLDILEQEQDTLIILNQHVLPNLEKESDPKSTRKKKRSTKTSQQSAVGVPVVSSSHGGIFVSGGMIRNIEKRLLPDLISRFAKERAVQLDANAVASENVAHYTKASSSSSKKKGGHKGKTGGKQSNTEDIDELSESAANLVPLYQLLQKLVEEYPELTEADREVRNLLENGSNLQLSWEGNQGQEATNSLLCEFCRTAMYTEDFIVKCQTSVEAEIKQLESARISKANLSRKDAATKIRNIDSAFEETFNTACYMLQSQVKFLEYVENAENVSEDDHGNVKFRDSLTNELLQGCCADFTSRLTQYCIFKNEMDSEQFGFLAGDFEEDQDRVGYMPHYCTPLDLAIRKYPPTFLSCIESGAGSDEESKTKGPLPKLREGFPGSIGVTLARQWTACGGVCYQGGTKIDEDEQKIARPGDLQKFMTHVEENCLTLCGYPFKKLDKKSEKQFLFSRRQRLMQLLEASDNAGDVLDFTIMLLFQQVKNMVVSGKHLRNEILKLLVSERKISEDVSALLMNLKMAVAEGDGVDSALLETVKACGISRDISKHTMDE